MDSLGRRRRRTWRRLLRWRKEWDLALAPWLGMERELAMAPWKWGGVAPAIGSFVGKAVGSGVGSLVGKEAVHDDCSLVMVGERVGT